VRNSFSCGFISSSSDSSLFASSESFITARYVIFGGYRLQVPSLLLVFLLFISSCSASANTWLSSQIQNRLKPTMWSSGVKKSSSVSAAPRTHTQQPIVTGTTVIGIKYQDGVMMAADTLASYGSLARYKDVRRIKIIGDKTLIGASGEISDFQSIMEMLDNMHQQDVNQDDGFTRTPAEIHSYLRAILYNRRNKGDPLWNQILVAGLKNDAPFLGYVDLIGTCYEENFVATGFGAYLAIPLIREKWDAQMSEGEARDLLEDCLRVLFYRDCRASNRIILAKVTKDGPIVSEPYELTTDWETANYDVRHAVPGLSAVDGSSW
jgi:20S proteasome subunit beta 7